MQTILFQLKASPETCRINVIETVLDTPICKSFAGQQFALDPMVTSASVIDSDGTEVLHLQKDAEGHCVTRVSK